MKMNVPTNFYKYQAVYNEDAPETNLSIQNLIDSKAVFSTRKNFNDVFDARIGFKKPTGRQLEAVRSKLRGEKRMIIERCVTAGQITKQGKEFFRRINTTFNALLDTYLFYCVSAKNNSNLMWSHYANSHKGFCIEFSASYLQADPVTYREELSTIDLLNAWAHPGSIGDVEHIGEQIWQALRIKLKDWQYEEEYRFQLSNQPEKNRAADGKNFILVNYEPLWVTSIIFGDRTNSRVKDYVKAKLPYEVQFKQAKANYGEIVIV